DDKGIGRLWATFASPKQSKSYAREHISTLPLHGISCRGFQFFAGSERQGTMQILFEAQRRNDGAWQFGPSFYPPDYTRPRARKWEDLNRERERTTDDVRLGKISVDIATIDAQDAADSGRYYEQQRLRQRTYELAQARVLDFIGAPEAQMQAAGRIWGHCC